MSSYLTTHYKGIYRILPTIDESTNDFVREKDGTICENDFYIPCRGGAKIFYYGHYDDNKITVWLTLFLRSIRKGREILRLLSESAVNIRDIKEADDEMIFNFRAKDLNIVAELVHPVTRGANISPKSTKNLPKSNYTIPPEFIADYKEAISQLGEREYFFINTITDNFLSKNLQRSMRKYDKQFDYSKDMRMKCMSRMPREYIHSLGMWDEYIKYLNKEIKKR